MGCNRPRVQGDKAQYKGSGPQCKSNEARCRTTGRNRVNRPQSANPNMESAEPERTAQQATTRRAPMPEQRNPVQSDRPRSGVSGAEKSCATGHGARRNTPRCRSTEPDGAADTDAGQQDSIQRQQAPVRGQQRREGLRERPRCRVSGAGPPPAALGRGAPSWRASPSWASWAFSASCVFRAAPEERDGPDVPDGRGGREAAEPREADGADGDAPDGSRRRRRRAGPAPAATYSRICVS